MPNLADRKKILDNWSLRRRLLYYANPIDYQVLGVKDGKQLYIQIPTGLRSDGQDDYLAIHYTVRTPEGMDSSVLVQKTMRLWDNLSRIDPRWDGVLLEDKWAAFVAHMDETVMPALHGFVNEIPLGGDRVLDCK